MYELKAQGAFEAAHQITGYPGKRARLHGHHWVVEATVRGTQLDDLGMLIDFKDVKKGLAVVLDRFDHRFLVDINKMLLVLNVVKLFHGYAFIIFDICRIG